LYITSHLGANKFPNVIPSGKYVSCQTLQKVPHLAPNSKCNSPAFTGPARIFESQDSAVEAISATDEKLNAGASLYEGKCEFCHGTADEPSAVGRSLYPRAPQFWVTHKNGEMDVADDPVGETYWKVKNGIRLSGMPAYAKSLSETQLWQVSLPLSMADKPLPAEASKTVGR
jgi:mono/diheme cytochrome c family protein